MHKSLAVFLPAAVAAFACLLFSVSGSVAQEVAFIPPNDTVGHVFTTNYNDAYSAGRGDVFSMQQNTTINSIGIFQNLTGVPLSYDIAQVTSTSGQVSTGETILRSGSATISTSGLQWVDFPMTPLALVQGKDYLIEFSFPANWDSNQNFYYNNNNVAFTTGSFTMVDGTLGGDATNTVMPAVRVNVVATPEPSTLVLACLAAAGVAAMAIRKRRNG